MREIRQHKLADVDIDLADRQALLKLIRHTPACQHDGVKSRTHNTGVYVTKIPQDPANNHAAIDYLEAEERGYFKLDLLNMSVYHQVKSEEHLTRLLKLEPPWSRLWTDSGWARQLVHIGNHVDLLVSMRPDSIPRLAAIVAIIRPGKAHLQNKPWPEVFASVWDGDKRDGFIFRKSHAIAYAMLIVVQMNLSHYGELE